MLLAACAVLPSPAERLTHARTLAAVHGWQPLGIPTGKFDLVGFVPPRIASNDLLTVYIEGDGLAWLDGETASPDPTPRDPLALNLAFRDPLGGAAYLAPPRQYI
jgi:hypothetical protein